jgi:hypothetical protein
VADAPSLEQVIDELLDVLGALAGMSHDAGQSGASCAPVPAAPTAAIRGVLGDVGIVRALSKGGIGIVDEAEQISLRRRIALKVLPFAVPQCRPAAALPQRDAGGPVCTTRTVRRSSSSAASEAFPSLPCS